MTSSVWVQGESESGTQEVNGELWLTAERFPGEQQGRAVCKDPGYTWLLPKETESAIPTLTTVPSIQYVLKYMIVRVIPGGSHILNKEVGTHETLRLV